MEITMIAAAIGGLLGGGAVGWKLRGATPPRIVWRTIPEGHVMHACGCIVPKEAIYHDGIRDVCVMCYDN